MRGIQILLFVILFSTNLPAQERQGNSDESPGKVWGYVFADYFYKAGGDSSGGTLDYLKYKKDFNAFEFRRVNIGYDYNFSESFVSTFSLSYDGEEFTSDGKRTVYVRDANIKWKNIFANSDFTFGLMATPGYSPFSDKVWSYRSVERTIMDQRGILGSRDLGVMLNGAFDKEKQFGYYLMIGNGRGTRFETNKYKRFYGNLFFNSLNKKIIFNIFGDYEPFGNSQSKYTGQAFLGYQSEKFNVGLEAFEQFQKNFGNPSVVTSPDDYDIIVLGASIFSNGTFSEKLKYFFRYDFFDPDNNNKNSILQHFFSAGLDFMPIKRIHIMPNLWLNAYSRNRKSDVVPRITFYFDSR